MENEIKVWTIKDGYKLGDDLTSKVLAFAFGLSAEIERNLISQRTKEALARKKAEGVQLGRPKGKKSIHYKLTGKEKTIIELHEKGLSKSKIAKILDVYLSQENLKNILLHETWHIKNHDVCTKQIINLLVIMYWWFIPVYRLRDKIDLFLEMRVDNQTTNPFSKDEVMKYMHTLIEIQKNIQSKNEFKGQSTHFMIQDNAHVLEYRINYLMDGMYRKKTSKILMIVVLALPLLTNSIILESAFEPPNNEDMYDQSDIDKGYIIKHKDGTYELVLGKKRLEMSNPNDEYFKDVPIKAE